jgi:hypothetical protein
VAVPGRFGGTRRGARNYTLASFKDCLNTRVKAVSAGAAPIRLHLARVWAPGGFLRSWMTELQEKGQRIGATGRGRIARSRQGWELPRLRVPASWRVHFRAQPVRNSKPSLRRAAISSSSSKMPSRQAKVVEAVGSCWPLANLMFPAQLGCARYSILGKLLLIKQQRAGEAACHPMTRSSIIY